MKFLVKESRVNRYIYQTINDMFDEDNTYGDYAEDYDYSRNRVVKDLSCFAVWKSDDDGDNESVMRWYGEDYFSPSYDTGVMKRMKSPMVELENKYKDILDGLFNDMWKEPFKKWFTDRFDLPVKTVE